MASVPSTSLKVWRLVSTISLNNMLLIQRGTFTLTSTSSSSELDQMEGKMDPFTDENERKWIRDGLLLQVQLREKYPSKGRSRSHLECGPVAQTPQEAFHASLYPESSVLDHARECVENLGECSIDEIESLQEGKPIQVIPMDATVNH